nr:hypothetical protein [Bradyrhizobium cenepequi]
MAILIAAPSRIFNRGVWITSEVDQRIDELRINLNLVVGTRRAEQRP